MLEKDRKTVIHAISKVIVSNLEVMPAERRPAYLEFLLDRLANFELSTLLFALRLAHPDLSDLDIGCHLCGGDSADFECEACGKHFCQLHFHVDDNLCSTCY